jgi:hypothetical protein
LDKTGRDRTNRDITGLDKTRRDKTNQDITSLEKTNRDKTTWIRPGETRPTKT